MEPMTLDSPVGSSSGPSNPGSPQSPYSPAFLIRDEFTSSQMNRSSYNQSFTNKELPSVQTSYASNKVLNFNLNEHQKQSAITKTGGPTARLLDSLDSHNNVPASLKMQSLNQSGNNTTLSNTTFGTPPCSTLDNGNWVTIFGFTNSNQCQSIIARIGQLGHIVEIKYPQHKEDKNWLHIKLSTKIEAKRVLACNGKIYGNSMIGVVPCRDMTVLRDTTNFNQSFNNSTTEMDSFCSPQNNTAYWEKNVNATPIAQDPPILFIRENENVIPQSLPSKDNGIVSKTLDYFFGW